MRYIFLLLVLTTSIITAVVVVAPKYKDIKALRAEVVNYQQRLETAKKLSASREELIARYNSIPKADLDNIKNALPDTVDNIRLIIQLDSIATKNGLSSLRAVQYDSVTAPTPATAAQGMQKPYGEFTISFETSGQYKNFLSFISDLEQNLRLIDIAQVTFAPTNASVSIGNPIPNLTYKVTVKTYWLKK
jgi:Tfp pilus assembly protein PilO